MQEYPIPAVGALIFNPHDEIFLMSSPMWNDQYIIPGGHVEIGESLENALIREVKEETNLPITDIQFLMFLECIYPNTFTEKKHFIFFDYVCRTTESHIILNEEATDFVWTPIEKIHKLPIEHYTKIVIDKYIQSRNI